MMDHCNSFFRYGKAGGHVCRKIKSVFCSLMLLSFLLTFSSSFFTLHAKAALANDPDGMGGAVYGAYFLGEGLIAATGTAFNSLQAAGILEVSNKEFGVQFATVQQAAQFVDNFGTWATNAGSMTYDAANNLWTLSGGKQAFVSGYKAATNASVVMQSGLVSLISQFIGGVTSGTITTSDGLSSIITKTGDNTSTFSLTAGTTYSISVSGPTDSSWFYSLSYNECGVSAGTGSATYTTSSTGTYFHYMVDGIYSTGWRDTALGTLGNSPTIECTSTGSVNLTGYNYGASSIDVSLVPSDGVSIDPDYSNVQTSTGDAGTTADVLNGLRTDEAVGVSYPSTVASSGTIPIDDVINGTVAAEAEGAATGTLENVSDATIADTEAAEAAGADALSPTADWTASADTIDWAPLEAINIDKFPFSLPFDMYNVLCAINVSPVAPKWTIPMKLPFLGTTYAGGGKYNYASSAQSVTIDFSQYEWFVSKVRIIIYIVFLLSWCWVINHFIRH